MVREDEVKIKNSSRTLEMEISDFSVEGNKFLVNTKSLVSNPLYGFEIIVDEVGEYSCKLMSKHERISCDQALETSSRENMLKNSLISIVSLGIVLTEVLEMYKPNFDENSFSMFAFGAGLMAFYISSSNIKKSYSKYKFSKDSLSNLL